MHFLWKNVQAYFFKLSVELSMLIYHLLHAQYQFLKILVAKILFIYNICFGFFKQGDIVFLHSEE
jgi:hypothetical protein